MSEGEHCPRHLNPEPPPSPQNMLDEGEQLIPCYHFQPDKDNVQTTVVFGDPFLMAVKDDEPLRVTKKRIQARGSWAGGAGVKGPLTDSGPGFTRP